MSYHYFLAMIKKNREIRLKGFTMIYLLYLFKAVTRSQSWAVNQWQTTAKKGRTGPSFIKLLH